MGMTLTFNHSERLTPWRHGVYASDYRNWLGASLAIAKSGGRATVRRALDSSVNDPNLVALRKWFEAHPLP